jgi:hypothetical protein
VTADLPYSILVTAYWDADSYRKLHLIGPYGSAAPRDREMYRLAVLPGNEGHAQFERSRLDPRAAHESATADRLAGAVHFNQVMAAFCGDECPTCQDVPSRVPVTGCPDCSESYDEEMT